VSAPLHVAIGPPYTDDAAIAAFRELGELLDTHPPDVAFQILLDRDLEELTIEQMQVDMLSQRLGVLSAVLCSVLLARGRRILHQARLADSPAEAAVKGMAEGREIQRKQAEGRS
jgi:hypothetical protein